MTKKIGVLLSGCGFLDGAEVRESTCTILALDQAGVEIQFMAPNIPQYHVVNHLSSEVTKGLKRNVLEESARIARGKIDALDKVDIDKLDGLIIPGGFGVAKNFCNFALKGHQGTVVPEVKEFICKFHALKKPMGALCIAPAMMALLFGRSGVHLTIGIDEETAQEIEKTGARHVKCQVNDIVFDDEHKIVSTPAYMFNNAKLSEIFEGIQKCVQKVVAWS